MVPPTPQGALQLAAAIPGDTVLRGKIIRVGVYARISEDKADDELGVERQLRDGDKIAEIRRWNVHDHYVDNDLSASKWNVVRPEFNRLLQDLEDGVIDGIVGYDIDRLFRLPVDLERTIKIYDFKQDLVFSTVQGDINLASDDGITMARVMVAFANKESRNTARRVARKHADLRGEGIPTGGARPFGWKASPESYQALAIALHSSSEVGIAAAEAQIRHEGRRRKDPLEAQLIIDGAHAILDSHGVYEIAARWNDMGYRTPRGNLWLAETVRALYMSPRLAGFRVHKKEVVLDENGQRIIGKYDKILEVAIWEAVRKTLQERAATRSRPKSRRYLLSSLLRCGLCGTKLQAKRKSTKYTYHTYVCPGKNEGGGCGKIKVHGEHVDAHIVLLWKAYISLESTNDQSAVGDWPQEQKLLAIDEQIAEVMTAYRNREISAAITFPMIGDFEKQRTILRNERAEWIQTQYKTAGLTANADDWDNMTVTERIIELQRIFSAIVIHPVASNAPRRFDPARVEPVWREYNSAGSSLALQESFEEHSLDSEQATLQSS